MDEFNIREEDEMIVDDVQDNEQGYAKFTSNQNAVLIGVGQKSTFYNIVTLDQVIVYFENMHHLTLSILSPGPVVPKPVSLTLG